ncbi:hypothetical protein [Clostridium tyrobutyricum]|uniref:hypothetical protein n=1 Tax=Clostridium tyrobutyricum TaxID=1519 RepID=UPI0009C1895C|nr:hypothetical protein [Clostridium tyrobutyricum]
MKIKILDDIFEIENDKNKVDEAFKEINELISSSNLQLKGIKIDGLDVYEDYYNCIISNLKNIDIIEVNVEILKEAAYDMLKSTKKYLETVIPKLELLVDAIYKDFNKEVWDKFIEFFDGLDSIINVLDAISKNNKCYGDIDKYALIKEKISIEIKNLSKAFEIGDRVWISDTILYEIKPIFKELQEGINCSL